MKISENIKSIKKRIGNAAVKAGKDPKDIKLLVVTKTQSSEVIDEAIREGIIFIAENRIQEAGDKIPKLKAPFCEFHFIGHLQSNKITKLIKLKPTLIHSIEKHSTAKKLNDYLEDHNISQDILVQINTSEEASKSGIEPENAVEFIKEVSLLSNVKIMGLMTIGMFTSNEKIIRKCFKTLKEIFDDLKKNEIPNVQMKYLSMGMTGDFEIAIEEGANIVRIGTGIFGSR